MERAEQGISPRTACGMQNVGTAPARGNAVARVLADTVDRPEAELKSRLKIRMGTAPASAAKWPPSIPARRRDPWLARADHGRGVPAPPAAGGAPAPAAAEAASAAAPGSAAG